MTFRSAYSVAMFSNREAVSKYPLMNNKISSHLANTKVSVSLLINKTT